MLRRVLPALLVLLPTLALAQPVSPPGLVPLTGNGPPSYGTGRQGQVYIDQSDPSVPISYTSQAGSWVPTNVPVGALLPTVGPAMSALTPQNVTSTALTVWWDAAVGVYADTGCTTPAVNGNGVACWQDRTGNYKATQSTSGQRPTLATSAINGAPALTFASASSQFLPHNYLGELGTVFIVYKVNNAGLTLSAGTPLSLMGGDTSASGNMPAYFMYAWTFETAVQREAALYARITNLDATNNGIGSFYTGTGSVFNQWTSAAYRLQGSGSGTNLTGYKHDGLLANSGALTLGANTLQPVGRSAALGATYYARNPGRYFKGQIAEVIIYSGALSNGDFASVQAYLNQKYNFQSYAGRYLAAVFNGPYAAANENLVLQQSSDATTWTYRPSHYWPAQNHAVRDPSALFVPSLNKWVLVHTAGGNLGQSAASGFDVATSNDGKTWTYSTQVSFSSVITVGANSAVWAPDLFLDTDGSVHAFAVASSDRTVSTGWTFFETHPTDDSFGNWSTPVSVATLPNTAIDAHVEKPNGVYEFWYNIDAPINPSYVQVNKSTALTSGYGALHTGNWASWGANLYEGTSVLVMADGSTRVFLDQRGNGYYWSSSTDNRATWTAPATNASLGPLEHGTFLRLY